MTKAERTRRMRQLIAMAPRIPQMEPGALSEELRRLDDEINSLPQEEAEGELGEAITATQTNLEHWFQFHTGREFAWF